MTMTHNFEICPENMLSLMVRSALAVAYAVVLCVDV